MRDTLSKAPTGRTFAYDLHPVLKMAELYNIPLDLDRFMQARGLHDRYTDADHPAVIEERDAACREILRALTQAEAEAVETTAIRMIEVDLPQVFPGCRAAP